MKLLEIETRSVRALPDEVRSVERDRNGGGNLTVVTGPPSVGLTSFLEAIAASVAVLGTGIGLAPTEIVCARAEHAMVRTTWALDADERAFGGFNEEKTTADVFFRRGAQGRCDADPGLLGLMSRYDHQVETSKVVYLPARRVTDGGFPAFGDFLGEAKLKRLSPAPDKFVGVPAALVKHASGFGEKARFDAVADLFAALVTTARLAPVDPSGQPQFILSAGGRVTLRELGLAERNAFVLASAPILMGLARSVILLDTPELGLAPGVAARWLDTLRAALPDAQWIVATRDAALVERVEPAARIELKGES
jgi:hypothetical protein